jgi:hypothetical protein
MIRTLTVSLWFASAILCAAQDSQPTVPAAAAPVANSGAKRALILCGLTGGEERHKAFAENVTKVHTVMTTKLGFAATDVEVLFGDEPQSTDVEPIKSAGRSTREELEKRIQSLRDKLRAEDDLWVVVFGYTYYDGRNSWLNLPGPDLHQADFAKLFAGLPARQQVFVITTPTSGFYIKPLSASNRVVISATEVDWETNETEFAGEFARLLSSPPPAKELDIDSDGQITLFDVYVTIARNLAQSYRDSELLATEHSLLDDNGDGRGTELQIDFLTAELGGRAKPGKPTIPTIAPTADGYFAKSIRLPITE